MNNFSRNLALWVIIGLLVVALFQLFQSSGQQAGSQKLAFSDFVGQVESDQVQDVTIQGREITGTLRNGASFETYAPDDPNLVQRLTDHNVRITAAPREEVHPLLGILLSWFPMLLLIGVWIFFMRQMQGGGTAGRWALAGPRRKPADRKAGPCDI